MKSTFLSLQQWWVFVKVQIKQSSQQYTQNATKGIKESMSVLEEELMKLQDVPILTKDGNVMENVKKKNNLLAEFLGLTTQGAIIRSRYQSVELIDAPTSETLEVKDDQLVFLFFLFTTDS